MFQSYCWILDPELWENLDGHVTLPYAQWLSLLDQNRNVTIGTAI
jgi:hypothetical protein